MNIKPIRNDQDYEEAILFLEALIEKDPAPESEEGDQLSILSTLVEDYEATRYPQTLPSPIEAIRFRMEQADLKPADLVPYIGSPSRVSEILSGKRSLTLDMIRDLEAGLGIPAKVLIQKDEPVDRFKAWSDALLKVMSKRNYFGEVTFDGANKESLLTNFFHNSFIDKTQLAWRKTQPRISARTDLDALEAWARLIEIRASKVKTSNDYKDGIIDEQFMRTVVQLSTEKDGPLKAQRLLLENGIILVVAEHLPKTMADGVTILSNKKHPVIGLSLRHDRLDNFWFTLLHELSHVALHIGTTDLVFIDEQLNENRLGASVNEKEVEADRMAQESIIPSSKWAISPAKVIPSPIAAKSLADELGIHTAIVAGYIQHKNKNYYYLKNIVNDADNKVRHMFDKQLNPEKDK